MLLSIAVITYNQEKFISQTLDSILSQKHNFEYEIIVGEDCSTDSTRKIIEQYVENFPAIIKPLYNEKNLGIVKNYFNVIEHCSGKYIMECAGDDWWLPGKVQSQIEFMEKHPDIGLCYGKAKRYLQRRNKLLYQTCGGKRSSFLQLLQEDNTIPSLTVCIRLSILRKYILEIKPLDKNWIMEDYPMWLWFSKNSKIVMLNELLGVYRIFSESACHSSNIEKRIKVYENYLSIKNFFIHKYTDLQEIEFDYFRVKAKTMIRIKEYSRFDVIKIFSNVKKKSKKDKILIKICNSSVFFALYRLRLYFGNI